MSSFVRVFLFVLCLALPAGAMADTTLVYAKGQGKSESTTKMRIRDGAIRSGGDGDVYMLYKADKDALYVINSKDESYAILDKDQIGKMGQRMDKVRAAMREKLKNMPKEQRERMKKKLSSLLKGPENVTYSRTGGTDKVAGYSCREGVVKRDGNVAVRLCVVPPEDLKMSSSEYETLSHLFQLVEKMNAALRSPAALPSFSSIKGVPVRWMQDGESGSASVLQSVSHEAIPARAFQVPADYKKKKPFDSH